MRGPKAAAPDATAPQIPMAKARSLSVRKVCRSKANVAGDIIAAPIASTALPPIKKLAVGENA